MHYDEEITNDGSTRATTSCVSSSFATRGGYNEEATTSLSLSLSLSVQLTLYKNINNLIESICPKSYLYLYDFSAFLHMCPSQNRSEPVLCIFHPEGHVFPTNSPVTPAWDVAPIRSASDTLPACRVSTPWSACLNRSRSCGSSSARTLVLLLAPGSKISPLDMLRPGMVGRVLRKVDDTLTVAIESVFLLPDTELPDEVLHP